MPVVHLETVPAIEVQLECSFTASCNNLQGIQMESIGVTATPDSSMKLSDTEPF